MDQYCDRCGRVLIEGFKYCDACGSPLERHILVTDFSAIEDKLTEDNVIAIVPTVRTQIIPRAYATYTYQPLAMMATGYYYRPPAQHYAYAATCAKMPKRRTEDEVNLILQWDEKAGHIFLDFVVDIKGIGPLIEVRKTVSKILNQEGLKCASGHSNWEIRKLSQRTVQLEGRLYPCLAILLFCKTCLDAGIITERELKYASIGHTLKRAAMGIVDFVRNLSHVKIGPETFELGFYDKIIPVKRCPV